MTGVTIMCCGLCMPCPLPVPAKSLGYTRVAELILDEAMSPTMRPRFYVRLVIDRSVCYSLSRSRHRQDRIGGKY